MMSGKIKFFQYVSITSFVLFLIAVLFVPTYAQGVQTLEVDPRLIAVSLGTQVQMDLKIQNGWSVNAFDIIIEYDGQKLSLITWDHGTYLSNLSCSSIVNQPGFFALNCSQLDQYDVSGDGVLLEITFDAVDIGNAEVNITEAAFINSEGITLIPQTRNGTVVVYSNITSSPTPTHTHTATQTIIPTATFTTTPTNIPTITSTASPNPSNTPTSTETISPINTQIASPTITEMKTTTRTKTPITNSTADKKGLETSEILTSTPTGLDTMKMDKENDTSGQPQSFFRILLRIFFWLFLIIITIALIIGAVYFIKFANKNGSDDGLL